MTEVTKNVEVSIDDMSYEMLLSKVLSKIPMCNERILIRLDGFLDALEVVGVNGKSRSSSNKQSS